MRYDQASDRWLLLDVSTTVSFQSPRSWCLPEAADQVLRHRRLAHGVPVPADADAFWLLLLHCLLDKGRVADHHRACLLRLAAVAPSSPLGASLCSATGNAFAVEDFVRAATSQDAQQLVELGVRLAVKLRRRRQIRLRFLMLLGGLARALRKPLLLRRRKGVSLALLGPNGVGKSTAAATLQRSLPFESRIIYLGLWKVSRKPRGRLRGAIEVATRPLRVWMRYVTAQYHQFRGRVVLFDRYVYEAYLPATPPLLAAKRIYFQFLAHAVPRPRATVVLDVPGDIAYRRKQENPPEELEAERRLYRQLTNRLSSIDFVDAGADAETVRAEITTIVWREVTLRWRGAATPS
jgi:energy-coupling factor transporter ATP-binding protein EcfA2